FNDPAHLLELRLDRRLTRGKRGRNRCDLDARPLHPGDRGRNQIRIDADGGHRRDPGIARIGPDRLGRQRGHLSRGVLALEGREIHHSHRKLERKDLGLALDRSLRERGGSLFERNRIDGPDPGQSWLEGKLETLWENRRLRHLQLSVAPSIRAIASLSPGLLYGASR